MYSAISLCGALALVSLVLLVLGKQFSVSYALGGAVYVIPHLYFVLYAFRFSAAQNVAAVTQSFFQGESGKLVLASVGFALVFKLYDELHAVSFFAGFVSMVTLQWFVAVKVVGRRSKLENET